MNTYVVFGYYMAWDIKQQRTMLKHSTMEVEVNGEDEARQAWVKRIQEDKSAASIKVVNVFGPYQKAEK